MRDNELYILIRQGMLDRFDARGLAGFKVKQNYQPTQQGRVIGSAVYMYKLFDYRYGQRKIAEVWNAAMQKIVRTETQYMESTFTFAVTMEQTPGDVTELTHSDVLKTVAAIFQSPGWREFTRAYGVGVERISAIRNTPYDNDRGVFEANPTFDVIITHSDVFVDDVPIITTFDFSIHSI